MKLNCGVKLCMSLLLVAIFATSAFCDSTFDRELIVKGDKTRAMKVESVFKELMTAYEDEDAQGFLDLVSDERFRQDYMTFTDALYNDFRSYEIRQVDYWIDRVVADHVKQFLYVKWEKRYENLDDGQQLTTTGYSRFLFDEVEGDYLLIELAGNSLFGGSLPEWVEEMPQISGQEVVQSPVTPGQPDLTITSASSDYVSPDQILSFTVQNIGNATSSPCTLRANPLYSVPMLMTYPIDALTPGESRTYSVTEPYDTSSLEVDSNDVVDESNESNNEYTMPYLP